MLDIRLRSPFVTDEVAVRQAQHDTAGDNVDIALGLDADADWSSCLRDRTDARRSRAGRPVPVTCGDDNLCTRTVIERVGG